jgi:hypothetical protein
VVVSRGLSGCQCIVCGRKEYRNLRRAGIRRYKYKIHRFMTIVDGCGERGDQKVESCGRRGTGIEVGSLVLFQGNDGLFGVGTWD